MGTLYWLGLALLAIALAAALSERYGKAGWRSFVIGALVLVINGCFVAMKTFWP